VVLLDPDECREGGVLGNWQPFGSSLQKGLVLWDSLH
jgi:hypothetical protein